MDSAELGRFLEIRDTGESRAYAVEHLSRELHRLRRLDVREAYAERTRMAAAARLSVLAPDDEALILRVLERELSAGQPEWEPVEWALIASKYGSMTDERLVELIGLVFTFPRGEKISDSHGRALREGVRVLWLAGSERADALLQEAREPAFWNRHGPIRSQGVSTDPVQSVRSLTAEAEDSRAARPFRAEIPTRLGTVALPSDRSDGHGAEWEHLTALREDCEARVNAAADALLARFLHEVPSDNVLTEIVHTLERARVQAANDTALRPALRILAREGLASHPDWALVDDALRICFHSGDLPAPLLEAIAAVLQAPRSANMQEEHKEAIAAALAVAGRIGTPGAVALLLEAATREFWDGGGPVAQPARLPSRDGTDPVDWARAEALGALAYAPSSETEGVIAEIVEKFRTPQQLVPVSSRYEHRAQGIALNARRIARSREGTAGDDHWWYLRGPAAPPAANSEESTGSTD